MRIAVVCATYVQGKSYQENVWAEQLAEARHVVRAFFAGTATNSPQRIAYGQGGYEIQPVKSRQWLRGTFKSRALPNAIADFKPDLIVICGDKTFATQLCRDHAMANVPVISTYSENLAMHEFDWRKRGISLRQRLWAIGFILVRGGPTRIVCKRSTLIVGNTPQAHDILARVFNSSEWTNIRGRMIDAPLGFSPEHFHFDPEVRSRVRSELGVAERDVLVCVTSHFNVSKEPSVRLIISALGVVMKEQPASRSLIVGFSDKPANAAVSQRIGEHIERIAAANQLIQQRDSGGVRFIKQPFADRGRLFELYNASDIAVFNRASISCQEALGTGLVGCFANDGSLNHLVTVPYQGVFFMPGNEQHLAAQLAPAVKRLAAMTQSQRDGFRTELASAARWLGYDRIIADILVELEKRKQAG